MKSILSIFLVFCFVGAACQTQPLARKSSLGVMLEESPAQNDKNEPSVRVLEVMPASTASNCAILPQDLIKAINGIPVHSIREVIAAMNEIREKEKVEVMVVRNGKSLTLSGKAIGKPQEKSEFATVKYGVVDYEGNRLRTILHLPKTDVKQPPVVFFIQGYPCQSIDLALLGEVPTRKLIDDWVQAGFAVYRIEKPGMGDSESSVPCSEIGFTEELKAFEEGYLALLNNPDIDTDNVFIFGHSLGGIVAPLLASKYKAKGVITYGTVVNTWFEYMQELTRVQGEMFNSPDVEVENDIRNATPFWYQLLVEGKSNQEILKNEAIEKMLEREGTLESFENGYFIGRHYSFWADIQAVQLAKAWSQVETNVLALYGEFDIQALNPNHIYQIERIVNANTKGKAEAKVIAQADHGFVEFDSMQENVDALSTGTYSQYLRNNYHSGIATTTVTWMKSIVGK